MTKLEKVIRELSDLRDFWVRLQKIKKMAQARPGTEEPPRPTGGAANELPADWPPQVDRP